MLSLSVVLFLGILVAAVATENSDRVTSRLKFLYWVIGWIVSSIIFSGAFDLILSSETGDQFDLTVPLIILAGQSAFSVFFYRAIVRRLRDAGHSKRLAYIAVIPILSWFIPVYLLFAIPQTAEERARGKETERFLCRFCGEAVEVEAHHCPHCQRDLAEHEPVIFVAEDQGLTEWQYNGETIVKRGRNYYVGDAAQGYARLQIAKSIIDSQDHC